MGTSEPADESPGEVAAYLKKKHLDFADHSLFFEDSLRNLFSTPFYAIDTYKLARNTPQSLMQLRIYDRSGKLVNAYTQCYGPFRRRNIIKTKEFQFWQFPTNFNLRFSDEPSLWAVSNLEKEQIRQAALQHDYTFVVYWNIWSNHYSKVMLKAVKKYLKRYESENFKIQVVLVNTGINPLNKPPS
jgi:hypothetical protein